MHQTEQQALFISIPTPAVSLRRKNIDPMSWLWILRAGVQAAPLPRLPAAQPGSLELQSPPPQPKRAPQADPDSDSEEEFMAAAILAVDGKGPPPEQVCSHHSSGLVVRESRSQRACIACLNQHR